jgi:flagellin-specific chaperone FliS
MKEEKVENTGDIKAINDLIDELNKIHLAMLSGKDNYKHAELYRWAKSNIEEYKRISKSESGNEIEIAISALYSLLLLRLQKKDVSVETAEAMQTFSNLLAHVALEYHKMNEE